jgi:hypothetical protein
MRVALLLFALWLIPFAAGAAEGDQQCLACHAQKIDAETFGKSMHAPVGCAACHAGVDLKQHPGNVKPRENARAFAVAAIEACGGCHQPIHAAWSGSPHGKAAAAGGPICSDCHSAHAVTRASVGTQLKEKCVACHAGAADAHDKWLPNSKRHLAVVACAACHAPSARRKVDLRFYDAAGKTEIVGGHGELLPGKPLDEKALWNLMQGASGDKVTLVGRIEVTSADQAHAMANRGEALKDCTTCHRKGADAFENVTVSVLGPDGQRVRYEARKEVLSAPTSVDSVRGFYAMGGTRVWILDVLFLLALAGGILGPLGHYVMRKLSRGKEKGNA